jgi:hypothetical protein
MSIEHRELLADLLGGVGLAILVLAFLLGCAS